MNTDKYMAGNELNDIAKLSALSELTERIANGCKPSRGASEEDIKRVKGWQRKLRTCVTYANSIFAERIAYCDPIALQGLMRRLNRKVVAVLTSDQAKLDLRKQLGLSDTITLGQDTYEDILDQGCLNCLHCAQGDKVKSCKFRQRLHELGWEVLRTDPKEGECEYRWDNEIRWVDSEYKKVDRWL